MNLKTKNLFVKIFILIATILLLAFVDFIVLEQIYHPMASEYNLPWASFEMSFFGKTLPMLK